MDVETGYLNAGAELASVEERRRCPRRFSDEGVWQRPWLRAKGLAPEILNSILQEE
jgi:hypothetical protein